MSNKKGFSLFDITASAVCLAPVLAGILFYSQLEQKMAVHFNSDFQADGFMDKRLFLFVLPVVLTLLQLGCIAAQNIKSPFFCGSSIIQADYSRMQLCLLFCNNRIFSRRSRQHRLSVLRRVLSPAFAGGSFSSVYEKSSVIC